nr:cis-aconitate decarboxylase-like [Nothobranchius furzeri]
MFSTLQKPSDQCGLPEDCITLQWRLNNFYLFIPAVQKHPAPEDTVTASFGKFISEIKPQHLSPVVLHRSKRMVLDSIGVGLIGSRTDVFELALQFCQVRQSESLSQVQPKYVQNR